MNPEIRVLSFTDYPRADTENPWWVGIKAWKRFTPAKKKRFSQLRRENKPCRLEWLWGTTHPRITERTPSE